MPTYLIVYLYQIILFFNSKGGNTMKNKQALEEISRILDNAQDDGRNGKAFEGFCKIADCGYIRGNNVVTSNKKPYDTTLYGSPIEYKTGCGELDTLIEHYNNNDPVIVCYSPTADKYDRYWLTVEDFIDGLSSIGLIRKKKSSRGKEVTAIQSFKNSRKKTAELYDMLSTYQIDPADIYHMLKDESRV
jgi:hypothetical protein